MNNYFECFLTSNSSELSLVWVDLSSLWTVLLFKTAWQLNGFTTFFGWWTRKQAFLDFRLRRGGEINHVEGSFGPLWRYSWYKFFPFFLDRYNFCFQIYSFWIRFSLLQHILHAKPFKSGIPIILNTSLYCSLLVSQLNDLYDRSEIISNQTTHFLWAQPSCCDGEVVVMLPFLQKSFVFNTIDLIGQ